MKPKIMRIIALWTFGMSILSWSGCADVTVNNPNNEDTDTSTSDTETSTESATDGDSDSDTDSDTDTDGDTDTDTDADTDTDTDTDTDSDADCELDISELFDAGVLPDGWAIETYDDDSYEYAWEWSNAANTTGGSGGYYWVNGAFPVAFDDSLISAAYTPANCSNVVLSYTQDFAKSGTDDFGFVQIQIDDGTWQTVNQLLADTTGSSEIDLSSFFSGAETQFRIRFRYVGNNDQYWKVDDFEIAGTP
jgi:hypothetical protein